MTDWTTDPRPLAECLRAFAAARGITRGVQRWLSDELAVQPRTIEAILQGRSTSMEPTLRRMMMLIDHAAEADRRLSHAEGEISP